MAVPAGPPTFYTLVALQPFSRASDLAASDFQKPVMGSVWPTIIVGVVCNARRL